MSTRVVTDSTADIPPQLADELGIRVVPIYIRFGSQIYCDGVDLTSEEFYRMLPDAPQHPSTSQPNPEDFTGVYTEQARDSDGIVSVHISSKISGTYNSAVLAKRMMGDSVPIEVVDSRLNSAGLGLVVVAAARLARTGASFKQVANEARRAVEQVKMFGMFETMLYLARGGRISRTIAAASRILNVMPLLTFHDGEIIRAGLVRTIARGIDRICDFVTKNTPVSELTIVHSAVPQRAEQLRQRLSNMVAAANINIAELGAGLGVHGGPGVLLVALRRKKSQPAEAGAC
jgi:DegV family protein with EDD domain